MVANLNDKALDTPPLNLGWYSKFILSTFPKYGIRRVKAKMQAAWLGNQGYITPSSNKRSMRDWSPSGASADVDTLTALDDSRAASRDLYMNTPVATALLRRMSTNVIGSGLILQSRIDRSFLGLSDEQADQWERDTEREFRLYAQSKNCDATRTQTFNQLQQLVFFNKILSGDVFILLPFRKLKNWPFRLTLQVIESDQCQNPNTTIDSFFSDKTRAGIQIDSFGAPTHYWFRTKHPGDPELEDKYVKIPAFGSRSGRRQVIHIFNKERPGQRRGMPMLAPVIEKLKMLSRLDESELMAAVISSFFTVFIKKSTGVTQGLAPSFAPGASVKEPGNPQDEFNYELGPGAMITLDEDESIDIADPKRPNDAYEPFFQTIVKEIGAALEIPFELVLLTFNSNYSASRAAILEGWKTFKKERINTASDFNQPVFEEWLSDAIQSGRIIAPGYFNDPAIKAAWSRSFWAGPGMGQIDPKKETDAAKLRIESNLSTYENESQAINGGDWEGSINRLARETKKIKEVDLNPISEQNQTATLEPEGVEDPNNANN